MIGNVFFWLERNCGVIWHHYMKWIFGLWGTEIVGIFYITGEDSGWTD